MSSSYHFGDEVTQHGDQNIGISHINQYGDHNTAAAMSQGPVNPQSALQEMRDLVARLRRDVAADDRERIDEAMKVIDADGDQEKGAFRQALTRVAGIAALAGEVGAPVIAAARKVAAAFGVQIG